jgi:lipoprotein LprG
MLASRLFVRRTIALVAGVAMLGATLTGCTHRKTPSTANLPDAATLMSQSETAMSNVQTVHFTINVQGQLAGLPITKAEGDLTRAGDAKGTASVTELGVNIEAEFVIVNKVYYFKGPTGGFQQLSTGEGAALFDPSSILDPNRGVVALMRTAKSPKTEARESVGGVDAYRVAVTPDPTTVAALVPGAGAHATGKIWIAVDTHKVVQGQFTVPGANANQPAVVTIALSNFDAPVTISAP